MCCPSCSLSCSSISTRAGPNALVSRSISHRACAKEPPCSVASSALKSSACSSILSSRLANVAFRRSNGTAPHPENAIRASLIDLFNNARCTSGTAVGSFPVAELMRDSLLLVDTFSSSTTLSKPFSRLAFFHLSFRSASTESASIVSIVLSLAFCDIVKRRLPSKGTSLARGRNLNSQYHINSFSKPLNHQTRKLGPPWSQLPQSLFQLGPR